MLSYYSIFPWLHRLTVEHMAFMLDIYHTAALDNESGICSFQTFVVELEQSIRVGPYIYIMGIRSTTESEPFENFHFNTNISLKFLNRLCRFEVDMQATWLHYLASITSNVFNE